ncbi:MAG: fumarylacetoacetate hydrolase family protein [Rhizobiales bacterium]|nr:fumarylacetoacetate hydrolase family protein [Hyphomicrobiales bacterium]
MKIGRYVGQGTREATGVLVEFGGQTKVLDLAVASAQLKHNTPEFASLDAIIASGRSLLPKIAEIADKARRDGEEAWFGDPATTQWLVPNRPGKCLCAGRNFGRHLDESKQLWAARSGATDQRSIPTGFVKFSENLVPHNASVERPVDVTDFDYEVEIAAIIGQRIERESETQALDAVFGYTVFNDLSAREWQFTEMENRMVMVGKNFPGAGPIGPWILTADEVPDPQALNVVLRVNGETRQTSSCNDMIHSFARLISFWSRLVLFPGDIICSGTPGGVAVAHKPDPRPWYLKPGDVVEAEVPQIGVLTTRIA